MGKRAAFYLALIIFMIIAPFVFPAFKTQLATVWLMIIVALTWDMTGGQMGYNSLGNITFYGTGMYFTDHERKTHTQTRKKSVMQGDVNDGVEGAV